MVGEINRFQSKHEIFSLANFQARTLINKIITRDLNVNCLISLNLNLILFFSFVH